MQSLVDNYTGLVFLAILLLVLGAMVVYYGNFVKTLAIWSVEPDYDEKGRRIQPKLETSEIVQCYIPVYQAAYAFSFLHYSFGPFRVMSITSLVFIGLRAINAFLLPVSGYVMFATVLLNYVGILLVILTYGIVTFIVARMYGFWWLTCVVCFIIPPLGAWWLAQRIPAQVKALQEEDVFDEHTDTIIKQRTN